MMIKDLPQEKNALEPERLISINPNSGEVLGSVSISDDQEVGAAVRRARAAQPAWARTPLKKRITIMRQVQEALVEQGPEVATLVAQEMGKPQTDALIGDLLIPLGSLEGVLKLVPDVMGRKKIPQDLLHFSKRTYLIREPKGVVGIISPYNYPVILSMQAAFPALVAGNSVIHKPSEFTSLSALGIQSIFHDAGLPRAARS